MITTNHPTLHGERLLQIARDTGLRHHLHGVAPEAARELLSKFSVAVWAASIANVADAIDGAIAFGASGVNPPPAGHWLQRFWDIGHGQAVVRDQALLRLMPDVLLALRNGYLNDSLIDDLELALKGTSAEPNDLEAGVTAIVTLMENGEWADILGSNPLLPRLWDAINDLYEKLDAAQGTPAAAVADAQPVAWGAFARGRLFAHCSTESEIDSYIQQVHQSRDDVTLCKLAMFTAPQSSGNPGPLAVVERDAELPPWWSAFVQNVCELPDRNSPDGEPEAMIVTVEELENAALVAIASSKENSNG